jgi:hypothetical protein
LETRFRFFSSRRLVSIELDLFLVTVVIILIIDVHLFNNVDHMINIYELKDDCVFLIFFLTNALTMKRTKTNILVRTRDAAPKTYFFMCAYCVYFMLIFSTKLKDSVKKRIK